MHDNLVGLRKLDTNLGTQCKGLKMPFLRQTLTCLNWCKHVGYIILLANSATSKVTYFHIWGQLHLSAHKQRKRSDSSIL